MVDAVKPIEGVSEIKTPISEKYIEAKRDAIVTMKAFNPIILMHEAMREATKALLSSLRTEKKQEKEDKKRWEEAAHAKAQTFLDTGLKKKLLGGGFVGGAVIAAIVSPTAGVTVAQIGNQYMNSWLDNNLQAELPQKDYDMAANQKEFEQKGASTQQLQQALESARQKEVELMRLEAKASGSQA